MFSFCRAIVRMLPLSFLGMDFVMNFVFADHRDDICVMIQHLAIRAETHPDKPVLFLNSGLPSAGYSPLIRLPIKVGDMFSFTDHLQYSLKRL